MSGNDDYKALVKIQAKAKKNAKTWQYRILIFLALFCASYIVTFSITTTAPDRHNVATYAVALVMTKVGKGENSLRIRTDEGNKLAIQARDVLNRQAILESKKTVQMMGLISLLLAVMLASLITLMIVRFLSRYQSKKVSKKTHLRGAKLVTPEQLVALIDKRKQRTEFSMGKVPIPKSIVERHMYLSGDTGNGKTQALMQLLDVIRGLEEKLIILDKNGEILAKYYDEERDYILSPFDDRAMNWTTYSEGIREIDLEQLARSFIPRPPEGRETHWAESSVNVFSVLLDRLSKKDNFQNAVNDMLTMMIESKKVVERNLLGKAEIVTKRSIFEIVKRTMASLSLDPDSPEHASSVLSSLIPNVRALTYMRGLENRATFSIKDWVKNPDDKGWVFIRVSEEHFELVEPLVRTWLDTAIKAVLSLKKPNDYRTWFVVDELQSMGKINSLKKGLHEGRGHGLRCVLGFTSINELYETYGENTATGMLSQCNTKVVFAVSEPKAANWNADLLGSEEVIRENESVNFGDRDNHGLSDHQHESRVVLPSQIQGLPPFTAFLKFSGDWPVTKIQTEFKPRSDRAPYSIERELPPIFELPTDENETGAERPDVEGSPRAERQKASQYRENEPLI